MHTQANNKPVRAEWDATASTYFWLMTLDPKNAHNNPNVKVMTGYSKYKHQSEAQDKEYLLKRKICMLYTNGWLHKTKHIEIFHNNTGIIDKKNAPLLLTCFRDHYTIPRERHDSMYKVFGTWLEQFYERVREGVDIEDIKPAVRSSKRINKDDFINPSLFSFQNVGQLYTHAAKLHKYGHAPGLIDAFVLKVRQRNQW